MTAIRHFQLKKEHATKRFVAHVCTGILLALMGCGGGGGGSGAQPLVTQETPPPKSPPPENPPPPDNTSSQVNPIPAGIWHGVYDVGADQPNFTALVLESGVFFAMYSVVGQPAVRSGLVHGHGTVTGGDFLADDAVEFNFAGAGASPGQLVAAALAQATLKGSFTVTDTPSQSGDFSLWFDQLYHQVPSLVTVAGHYDGELDSDAGAEFFSLQVSDAGDIAATGSGGCRATGTISPAARGNAYVIEIVFGASPCALPGQAVAGAGFYDPNTNLLLLGLVDPAREHGMVFAGPRDGGLDSDDDGIIDSEDDDDDNDERQDGLDNCPLDTRPACPEIIVASGRYWQQPSLFTNLSWTDIDAICPAAKAGACDGVLNGRDLSGWTWASSAELRTLFEYYGFTEPSDAVATELDLPTGTLIAGYEALDAWWLGSKWLPTSFGCPWDYCVYWFAGYTRDGFRAGSDTAGQGHIGQFYENPVLGEGIVGVANHYLDDKFITPDTKDQSLGAWFYRNP